MKGEETRKALNSLGLTQTEASVCSGSSSVHRAGGLRYARRTIFPHDHLMHDDL